MCSNTPIMKLFALALLAWAVLGTQASGGLAALLLGILLFLLALLDAGHVVPPGAGREMPLNDADIGALVRRLFGVAVGPFYLVLIVLACAGILGKEDHQTMRQGGGETYQTQRAQAEATMCGGHGCGSAGGCGTGGCGASSGGACGCGGGAKKAPAPKPKPVISTPEAKARAEAMQKRTMSIPTANLPGIGPNAKPLPPGLVPNPNAKLPPGVKPLAPGAEPSATGGVSEVGATEPQKSEASGQKSERQTPSTTNP